MKYSDTFIQLVKSRIDPKLETQLRGELVTFTEHMSKRHGKFSVCPQQPIEDVINQVADSGSAILMEKIVVDGWNWAETLEGDSFWFQVYHCLSAEAGDPPYKLNDYQKKIKSFIESGDEMDLLEFALNGYKPF